jgi:hypothetical protein
LDFPLVEALVRFAAGFGFAAGFFAAVFVGAICTTSL